MPPIVIDVPIVYQGQDGDVFPALQPLDTDADVELLPPGLVIAPGKYSFINHSFEFNADCVVRMFFWCVSCLATRTNPNQKHFARIAVNAFICLCI